jgi:hypothetical protein
MKLPSLNGWMSWSFDDVEYGVRTNKDSVYNFHLNLPKLEPLQSYQQELYNNAMASRDYFSGQFDVLLSGGIDSEVIVRTLRDVKIKHNTYIFRYENNYNHREVSSAIDIATCLGIDYKIIDFSLKDFFENEAYDLFKKSGCIRAGRLVHLGLCDRLDNIPIMGEGEPYWYRTLEGDYSSKSEWKFPMNESNHNVSMYLHSMGRENLCDWYEFTPNVINAFNKLPMIQDLISDKIYGKHSSWSCRVPIHQAIWTDLKPKPKLIGYEQDNPSGTYPEFIIEFQKIMTAELGDGNEYWFTEDEVKQMFGSV